MNNPSIYYSVLVTRKLLCSCAIYKFPHSVGTGACLSFAPIDISKLPYKISKASLARAQSLLDRGRI